MAKHIGIVACSAEGAALCYRTICLEAQEVMGKHNHPEITMSSIPMARHLRSIGAEGWGGVATLMLEAVAKVAGAGAAFAICPDNTLHEALPLVLPRSPIPWLSIADVVAAEAKDRGFRRLGILGTKYLMEGPVYPRALEPVGIEWRTPGTAERDVIDAAIFEQLVNAVFKDETRAMFNRMIERLKGEGCDAAVLGCTEIPLIVRPEEAPLPTLDSTRLLARAALRRATSG